MVTGFHRTCVVDGGLEHSPAEYVRRRAVPPESPAMLGLLGLRIFEATGSNIGDLGERSTVTAPSASTAKPERCAQGHFADRRSATQFRVVSLRET